MELLKELNRRRFQRIAALSMRFSDGGGNGDPASEPTSEPAADPVGDPAGNEPMAFSQADVDKLITDKLTEQKASFDKTLQEKIAEALKVEKLPPDQKAEHEKAQAAAALAQREAEITKRELKADAKEILFGKGLPAELADVLDYSSAESCTASIAAVEKAFSAAVAKAVNDKIRGKALGVGPENQGALTREQVARMTPDEINANWDKIKNIK